MRYTDIHIAGLGTELGELIPSEIAIADGRFHPTDAAKIAQRSVSCATRGAAELAITAGRRALAGARRPDRCAVNTADLTADLILHLHTSVCGAGIAVWSQSSYILNQLGGAGSMMSAELNAVSNGCLAAVELAAQVLTASGGDADQALVTAADRFTEPYFPRWSTERGLVFGDGAGAAVLGRRPGLAALLATASFTDPTMEGLHRGNEEIVDGGRPHSTPIDLRARSRAHLDKVGGPAEVTARHAKAVEKVVDRVLQDAGIKAGDLTRIVLPFFGRDFIEREYLHQFGIRAEDTLLELGLVLGHLGAADQLVGLDYLVSSGLVGKDDLVLLIGVGAGFTWTAAVVRIEREAAPVGPSAPSYWSNS